MKLVWHPEAWDEYVTWQQDKPGLRRLNRILADLIRNGDAAQFGQPERLRGAFAGWSSREIDQRHRLVYRVRGDETEIIKCRGHYDD